MTSKRIENRLRELGAVLVLALALFATYAIYRSGLSGTFHFDDAHNLGGLAQIADWPSAFRFIVEGVAGPLGRPLALASFIPQAYAWPHSPDVFLHVNACLHVLNGALVVWFLFLVSTLRGDDTRRAAWLSVGGGTIWMLLPILASSSLFVVQRMTTLSATFSLLGLIGYLFGRRVLAAGRWHGLIATSAAVSIGTVLAALAKENGALLPVLILVLETTLLPRINAPALNRVWSIWRIVFLGAPAALLLGYLLTRLQYSPDTILFRGYSSVERLLTEARILWQYLYAAFLPSTSLLGPFHDDQTVVRSLASPAALAAVAWGTVVVAAIVVRQRAPLFSFGVLWYLAGHALESTTLPLELYFEHRNYVPLIGVSYALVAGLASINNEWRRAAVAAVAVYAAMLAVVLWNSTSLWGNPRIGAEIWAAHHPASKRAAQYLAQQLELRQDYASSRRVLASYLEKHPGSAGIELQILLLSCAVEPDAPRDEALARVRANLATASFEHGAFETLATLYRMSKQNTCLDRQQVYDLAAIALSNPAFVAIPVAVHNLNVLMAEEMFEQRKLDATMRHIEDALAARYTMTTLVFAVQTLCSAGLFSIAETFIEDAKAHSPRAPLLAMMWDRQLTQISGAVATIAASRANADKAL